MACFWSLLLEVMHRYDVVPKIKYDFLEVFGSLEVCPWLSRLTESVDLMFVHEIRCDVM